MADCNLAGVQGVGGGNIQAPIEADVLAPFVKIKFLAGGTEITVGNKPSPSEGNLAIIKSFDYEVSNGMKITLDIIDQKGGSFSKFVKNIFKCVSAISETQIEFEFGWIIAKCGGSSDKKASDPKKAVVTSLNVQLTKGYHRYKIVATDLGHVDSVTRTDKVLGGDKKSTRKKLKDAITELLKNHKPAYGKNGPPIRYLRKNCDGSTSDWEFEETEKLVGTWPANSKNPRETIEEWVKPFLTDQGKGMYLTVGDSPDQLILWEKDKKSDCGRDVFIVNGGPCSKVIDFQPEFNWLTGISSKLTSGGATTPTSQKVELGEKEAPEEPKQNDCQPKEAGVQSNITIPTWLMQIISPKEQSKEVNKNQQKQAQANTIVVGEAITANMVIQGDPSENFISVTKVQREIAIVVINPFGIEDSRDGCNWLATPATNEVLTNKSWRVRGISHSIREGSYTTTMDLFLDAPGIDLNINSGLGGSGFNPN